MPTMREVAEKAQVSPTTVSHVINNTRFVSEDVRDRVLAVMKELGYRPNALARSLRRGITFTIGLILPDSANPFFAEVGRSIEESAFQYGYNVILCNTEGSYDREQIYVDLLIEKQVDGLIFVAAGDQSESLRSLLEEDVLVVLIDRRVPGIDVDVVLSDNRQGGYLATRHLIDLGHSRIACLAGPSNVTPSSERVTGYLQALREAGLAPDEKLIVSGNFRAESGFQIIQDLLRLPEPPTAVFASNDLMAIGAMRAAAQNGLRVPEDISIVGFDDIELASYVIPALTTVRQPKSEMGKAAVELLIRQTKTGKGSADYTMLENKLIIRDSTGKCP
jgi:LacI family transcriptional regulator